jgi:tetratricopeptide (TPR) repeat protein
MCCTIHDTMMPRAKPFVRPEFTERFNQHLDTYKRRMERAGVQVTEQALATELGRYNRGTLSRWRKGDRVPDDALKKLCELVPLTEAECQELRQLAGYIAVELAAPETVTAAQQALIDSIREVAAQAMPAPAAPVSAEEAQALLASLPLDRVPEPQTLPSPHRMPLHPNQHFVGRDDKLRELAGLLKTGGTVAIITGIGGMGKTQLSAELVHRYGAYFAGGVFWVSCAEPADIPGEIADCGLQGLITRQDYPSLSQEDQVKLVRAALAEPIPRLLVFDNCKDEQTLRPWLPTTGGVRVIVTSRKQTGWSSEVSLTLLRLGELAREDSITLLQQLARHLAHHEANEIAQKLGDLPLALHLAGRYLARYRTPVDQYLDKLDKVRFLPHPSLQGRGVETMPTDREPHVEKAFTLSLACLDSSNPIDNLARQLLARAACLAPGELIGQWWLDATIFPEGDEEEQQLARTDAVERLLDLGLLELVAEGVVRLHRLLAAYAVLALSDGEALSAVERVVSAVAYQANETGVPQAMLPVLPHLRYLVQQAWGREDEMVAILHSRLDEYLCTVGAYQEALFHSKQALAITEQVLGSDHPNTVSSLNNLAESYRAMKAYGQALPLYERALGIRERVLGKNHPDTAVSLGNLAKLYLEQGAYKQALPLLKRALSIRERVLGNNHPDTAMSLNDLAGLYAEQGAYEQALPLLERALALYEQLLGADHLYTLTSLQNLAALYVEQGAYEQALPQLERVVAVLQACLGPQHPHTTQVQQSLAELHRRMAIADLPPTLGTAFEAQDWPAFWQALLAFPPEEASSIVQRLIDVGLLRKPDDDPFAPLLQAVVAVAQGDDSLRPQVEAELARREQGGWHLTAAVQAILTGERDAARLTQGLDDQDTELIRRLLTMLTEAEAAKQRADLLARAEARVAAVGSDPQARAELAERLATVAASYASGSREDQALAAQLRAFVAQLHGQPIW